MKIYIKLSNYRYFMFEQIYVHSWCCITASYLFTCGFETNERGGEWCGITQADSTYDTMDWIRQTGRTPSGQTGPDAAIKGSYYAYIEASGKSPNDNAVWVNMQT